MRTLKRNVTNRIACILALALTLGQIPQPVYAVEKADIIEPASESLINEEVADEVIAETAGEEIVEPAASDMSLTSIPMSDTSNNNNEISPDGDPQTTHVSSWGNLRSALENDGDIILDADIIATGLFVSPLSVPSGKIVILDLNGHTIDRGADGFGSQSVIIVEGNLTIKDSDPNHTGKITGGYTSSAGAGVQVNNGTFNMEGGSITGNMAASGGGGVAVGNGGIFNMAGGSISGNTSSFYGGGVFASFAGTFNMTGGSISGNIANSEGGGVYIGGSNSRFVMEGGSINHNEATGGNGGGGVYVIQDGTFEMKGGNISGNTAVEGGGVTANGTFSMTGGSIIENTALSRGGGVYVFRGTFSMTDGIISENEASSTGGGVDVTNGTFNMTGGSIARNKTTGGNGGGVHVFDGIFDMNGGSINKNEGTNGGGVCVQEGTFNMTGGSIAGNTSVYNGGGVEVEGTSSYPGSFNMTGGSISGNTANEGGGVCVIEGTFNMNGGSISGNTANEGGGVGVYGISSSPGSFNMTGGEIGVNVATMGGGVNVGQNGSFEMSGGSIDSNKANDGGGVHLMHESSRFLMTNGRISGNEATSGNGGGVSDHGTFEMEGGSISGNEATSGYGGGVLVDRATFSMTDGSISGNTAEGDNYGHDIGIATENGTYITITGGIFDKTNITNLATITFKANGGSGSDYYHWGLKNKPIALSDNRFTRNSYSFTGWNSDTNGSGISYAEGETIPSLDGDMTLYAQWEVSYTPTHTHSYRETVTLEPTCTEPGIKTFNCTGCTYSYTQSIPALGHAYDAGVITRPATVVSDGLKTFTCTKCGATKTEVIPKLDPATEEEKDIAEQIEALIEDLKDETGELKVEVDVKTEKKDDGTTETVVTVGGEEVVKIITDEDGEEKIESNIWSIGGDGVYTYTGLAIKPDVQVYDGLKKLSSGSDYSVSYKNNTNAGTKAEAKVSFKGGYKGTPAIKATFTINPADLSKDATAVSMIIAANGKDQKPIPEVTLTSSGKSLGKGDLKYRYLDSKGEVVSGIKEVGDYTVEAKGKKDNGNFTGVASTTITVMGDKTKVLSNGKVKLTKKSYTYTGKPIIPEKGTYTLTLNGTELEEGKDYTLEVRNNMDPGKATMIFTAADENKGGYVGSINATFKIEKGKELKAAGEGSDFRYIYEDSVPFSKGGAKPELIIMDEDTVLTPGKDYTVSYSENTKVTDGKDAVITVKGKGIYKGKVTLNYAVVGQNIATLSGNIVVSDKAVSKKGYKDPAVTITDLDGKKLAKDKDYALSDDYTEPDENGVVTVTLIGKGNYSGSVLISYRYLNKNAMLDNVSATKIADKVYTGSRIRLTKKELAKLLYIGNVKNPTYLVEGKDFEVVGYSNNLKTGTAKVTLRGIGDRGGTKTVSFKIVASKKSIINVIVGALKK